MRPYFDEAIVACTIEVLGSICYVKTRPSRSNTTSKMADGGFDYEMDDFTAPEEERQEDYYDETSLMDLPDPP